MIATANVRRAADRYATTTSWLNSRHSFSFGDHYDPGNTHHGLLMVNNEDIVAPGTGFGTHPHRDMEIVTWVLQGELTHADSLGNTGTLYPGLAQRMSAGSGILHSETNDSAVEPVHFVQMWVMPDQPGGDPNYQQQEIGAQLSGGDLVPIAAGIPGRDAAIGIGNRNAALSGARLAPGGRVDLPHAPYLHLFIPRGRVTVEGVDDLGPGDAVRFTGSGGRRVTAIEPAEILLWEMYATLGG